MTENEVTKILKGAYSLLLQCRVSFENVHDYKEASEEAIKALEEVQEYRKLGTVEECREAVEKTKAKKIKYYGKSKRNNCPTCKQYLGWNYIMDYCKYCGQRLESEA